MKKETLYKYFNNQATEGERKETVAWAQSSPDNLKEFCHERNIYNAILLSTNTVRHTQYDFRRHYRIRTQLRGLLYLVRPQKRRQRGSNCLHRL